MCGLTKMKKHLGSHLIWTIRDSKWGAFFYSKKLAGIIIAFGILLRLRQYLFNRSLWLDEALIVFNIINRSFSGFFEPLDYNQGAPIGFLLFEKLSTILFNNSEYVLRLFPLVAGIISLFLFYEVAKSFCRKETVPIALGLFALSDRLIYYSSEVKPYSSDVTLALLLYVVFISVETRKSKDSSLYVYGMIAIFSLWFSFPALFILTAVGSCLWMPALMGREWKRVVHLSSLFLVCGLSLMIYYLLALKDLSHNANQLDYWRNAFMPFPPKNMSDVGWFVTSFENLFRDPVGLYLKGFGPILAIFGCFSLYREKKRYLWGLLLPLLLALFASGFHLYPFSGRLLLFIVPILIIIMSEGILQFSKIVPRYSLILGVIVVATIVWQPFVTANHRLLHPRTREELRPVLSYVNNHFQPGDTLYLYYAAWPAFQYYAGRYPFEKAQFVRGVSSRKGLNNFIKDLDNLRGNGRTWIIFSHVSTLEAVKEKAFVLSYLDRIGRKEDTFAAPGAAVYLYELRW
jgi:4-amino-4-deoxy-L-arabinose transferase-like glycosyltransferase